MGLDAVVFINKAHLPLDENVEFKLDEQTGEVYFDEIAGNEALASKNFTAIHKRLGNIELIGRLRKDLSLALGNHSVLWDKILYSGSHAGDTIGLEDVEKLESEIDLLKSKYVGQMPHFLNSLLNDLIELAEAAKTEKNPIVFI